ncbi:MAG: hypothetical protein WCK18_15215 [Prolixibacteraceae bacterium]
MERRTEIEKVKSLFGENFLGSDELAKIAPQMGIQLPAIVPEIPYSRAQLETQAKDSILILGINKMANGEVLSLLSLREQFGTNPDVYEPCFYNQDWYLREKFMQDSLENKWYLIKKTVYEDSRAILPEKLITKYNFPTAILCAYSFFVNWFVNNEKLWKYDFLWCSDVDHNGDRIYVGKYIDVDGLNKNGFSIHRYLSLKSSYATISMFNNE